MNYLFDGLLLLFTLSVTVLGAITLSNVFRLRNIQMSWKNGTLKGYPLFSSLFLVFMVLLLGAALWEDSSYVPHVSAYVWISINWFIISHMASTHFITDHGIVKNINDPSQTVPWHQIADLVERDEGNTVRYTFMYFDKSYMCNRQNDKKCVRLELVIPKEKQEMFRKILSYKLGRRFNCFFTDKSNIEQLP